MGEGEVTLRDLQQKLVELDIKVDMLVTAAKEGGGLVKVINYKEMNEWRQKSKLKGLRCKKDCIEGPCRYGGNQALDCYEKLEVAMKKRKRRLFFLKHIPYKVKVLQEFRRKDLIMLLAAIGGNMRKMFKAKAGNNELIHEIIKLQPKYIEYKLKREKKKNLAQKLIEEVADSANNDGQSGTQKTP